MTHSLFRRGSVESLRDDFVFLITPAIGVNHVGARDKLLAVLQKIATLRIANIGSYETGNMITGATFESIGASLKDSSRIRCVFSEKGQLVELLRWLKREDLGLSVTVSGLIDEIEGICGSSFDTPLRLHSINMSLGIWGAIDKLPDEEELELVTMCGHGLISRELVRETFKAVRGGRLSPEEGARRIGTPCVCGIFNLDRATRLLETSR